MKLNYFSHHKGSWSGVFGLVQTSLNLGIRFFIRTNCKKDFVLTDTPLH